MTEKLADLDDLFADDAIRNPYAFFGRIRETDPVHWNARHQLWIITRHADVVSIVRDHESFSSAVIKSDSRPPYPPLDENGLTLLDEVRRFRGAQLVEQDPPRHSSMRRLLHQYFTAQAIEKWRPFIRSAVVELLDEIESGATLDVMTALAAPLPVRVIAHLMDVPANDRPQLRELADKLLYINRGEPNRFATLVEGIRGILDYSAPLAEVRVREPGTDFISVLAEGERLGVMDRPAVRPAGEVDATHRHPGRHCGRTHDSRGGSSSLDHRGGQPGSGCLPRAGPVSHRPAPESACIVRRRHPLLPRRRARARRGSGALSRPGRTHLVVRA
jgi:cytochrome P450